MEIPVFQKEKTLYGAVARYGETLKIIVTFKHFSQNGRAGFRYTIKERTALRANFCISIARENILLREK